LLESSPREEQLTSNQKRSFWAAWGGWALDGMDSFIYALVLVPAVRELLPRSGIPADTGNIGYYGGLLFALFLIGWGCGAVWGPVADRFGRARTLMFTILCFSLFTLLSAFSMNIWMLAVLRFFAGVGIGGEWSMGATLLSEEWPEKRRTMGAALMHTGYYFGFFLAALANYFVGSYFGWRIMFVVGGTPALLVAFFYNRLHEPTRWEKKQTELEGNWSVFRAFSALFTRQYRRRTILNSLYILVSTIGLWGGSVYVPSAVTYLATKAGLTTTQGARWASYGTALLSVGTILGALIVPGIADRFGRKINLALFFVVMFIFIVLAFGYVYYLESGALQWFMVCIFFLGIGGANFTVYSFWVPEQYGTECRGSALSFTCNVGRFVGAGVTYLVGAGVQHFQTLGIPVALTAVVFLIGLLFLPLAGETKGKPLPA
jgi:MFS family permease